MAGVLQWTRDGFGLGNERQLYAFKRYQMIGSNEEGDYSLRISPVTLEDDAVFQCQATGNIDIPGIRSQEAAADVCNKILFFSSTAEKIFVIFVKL